MCQKHQKQEATLHAFCSYCKFCLLNKGYTNLLNWWVVRNNSENPENTSHHYKIAQNVKCDNGMKEGFGDKLPANSQKMNYTAFSNLRGEKLAPLRDFFYHLVQHSLGYNNTGFIRKVKCNCLHEIKGQSIK